MMSIFPLALLIIMVFSIIMLRLTGLSGIYIYKYIYILIFGILYQRFSLWFMSRDGIRYIIMCFTEQDQRWNANTYFFLKFCSSGGVVIASRDGKIVFENTLDARLDVAFNKKLPEVGFVRF